MRAEIILDWEYGTPKQEGIYFIAVKHGEGAGFQEFATWDKGKWFLNNGGEVVAFIGIESLNQQLNVQWPQLVPQASLGSEGFEEV